jgi:fructokinase
MTTSDVFRSTLDSVLGRADIVKVSGDDLEFMFPNIEPDEAARRLQSHSGAVVLFTDGAKAVRVFTGADEIVLDVPKVPVVDTVGAGDSFSGGFLAQWMQRGLTRNDVRDIDKVVSAALYGIAVAGITCQRPGADPPRAGEVKGY